MPSFARRLAEAYKVGIVEGKCLSAIRIEAETNMESLLQARCPMIECRHITGNLYVVQGNARRPIVLE